MFLLQMLDHLLNDDLVFVSYIRRYVLTDNQFLAPVDYYAPFSSPIFGDMFLLQ